MLALPFETRGPIFLAHDDVEASRVFVSLTRPRVARRSDGTSRARLVQWVRAEGRNDAAGARLSLDIEMEPTAAEIAALGVDAPQVALMPWSSATIRLDGPGFDAVEAAVSSMLPGRGAVAVDLSSDAGALLAALLTGDTVSPLQVTWRGVVPVRLPAVEVIASADITEITRRITLLGPSSSRTTVRQIIDGHAHIEIRNAANPDIEQALRAWVLDEFSSQLAQGKATLAVRAAAADVVMWPLELSTTLEDLIPPAHRGSIVETVVLDDSDLGRVPPVDVRVLADFAQVERVDVRLAGGDLSKELAFTSDSAQRVPMGAAPIQWSHRVKRTGRPVDEWPAAKPLSGRTVIVAVPPAATRKIDVFGAGLDFNDRWSSVGVHLAARRAGATLGSSTVELTAAHTSGSWNAPADDAAITVSATLTYLSRFGDAIERTIDTIEDDFVLVRDPLAGAGLRVTLLPAGSGWDDVALAMADVRFTDGAHVVHRTLELRKLTDLAECVIPARPDGPQTIDWRLHVSRQDGAFASTAWQPAPAGVVVLRLDGPQRRLVQLLPVFFDAATTRSGTVRLRSGTHTETVVISDRNGKSVTLPPGPLTWTIQWTMSDGRQLDESAPLDGDDVIVLPRAAAS